MQIRISALLFFCVAATLTAADSPKIVKSSLTSERKPRTYWAFAPPAGSTEEKLPLIVALHGSGRNGEPILQKWKDLAEKERIVLAGPDSSDPAHWGSPTDGPAFLRDVVEDVKSRYGIDAKRVYLFGHSARAGFALEMAALESEYFAAVAIHAGALHDQYFSLLDYAKRKTPYAIWIGTRDAFFPLDQVRATRDALKARGFTVEYTELSGHTHDYYGSAREINKAVWDFLKNKRLLGEPKYEEYQVN